MHVRYLPVVVPTRKPEQEGTSKRLQLQHFKSNAYTVFGFPNLSRRRASSNHYGFLARDLLKVNRPGSARTCVPSENSTGIGDSSKLNTA